LGKPPIYIKAGSDGHPYDIISYGKDGKEGGDETAQDLSIWD